MPINNRQREQMLASCGEIQEDDGVDPRHFIKHDAGRNKRDRKTLQLCQQVGRTLSLVLSGEFSDEVLQSLIVESVIPNPNAGQLLVTVSLAEGPDTAADQTVALLRLDQVAGRLRTEVARSITRKRAPKLKFRVVMTPSLNNATTEGNRE